MRRRFVLAFLCLSTLALAQNVVAGTLDPSQVGWASLAVEGSPAHSNAPASAEGRAPRPATMVLLVAGLAGLTAAGHRRSEAPRAAR